MLVNRRTCSFLDPPFIAADSGFSCHHSRTILGSTMNLKSERRKQAQEFQRAVEKLLRPILGTLLKLGPKSALSIERHLAGGVAPSSGSGKPSSEMRTAVIWLISSELIDGSLARLQLHEAGKEMLLNTSLPITKELLESIPAFQNYWRKAAQDRLRREFLDLRFQHYVAGRASCLQGNFVPSGILLSYAIEYHLKAAISEATPDLLQTEEQLLRREHDLVKLFALALKYGFFAEVAISRDFLRYASDHFKLRYPSSARTVGAEVGYIQHSSVTLHTYDDAIIQLDESLSRTYADPSLRMGVSAFSWPGASREARAAFLHANIFAVGKLGSYLAAVPNRPSISHVGRDPIPSSELLFESPGLPPPPWPLAVALRLEPMGLAKYFIYHELGLPDPDPARLLRSTTSAAQDLGSLRWVLTALLSEFGDGQVEVVRKDRGGLPLIRVFDRRAMKWVRELDLEKVQMTVPGMKLDKMFLNDWMEATRQHFQRRRRL